MTHQLDKYYSSTAHPRGCGGAAGFPSVRSLLFFFSRLLPHCCTEFVFLSSRSCRHYYSSPCYAVPHWYSCLALCLVILCCHRSVFAAGSSSDDSILPFALRFESSTRQDAAAPSLLFGSNSNNDDKSSRNSSSFTMGIGHSVEQQVEESLRYGHYDHEQQRQRDDNEEEEKFGRPRPSKLLVFPPLLFESHLFIFKRLAQALHRSYGHQVTFFVSDRRRMEEETSLDYSVRRFPGLFSTEEGEAFLKQRIANILTGKKTFLELFEILAAYSKNCDLIFTAGREALEQLRNDHYDYMVVDPNEMCGFVIARELSLPQIVFSTGMWVPYEASMPSPIAYVPEFNTQLSDRMSFTERMFNAAVYMGSRFTINCLILPIYNRLMEKHHVGERGETVADLHRATRSWLLSTDLALEFARPMMPHVEYVGGLLGKPASPLPQELQEWADDSKRLGGFVIVSFGAGVSELSPKLETMFARVLSSLPYQVIWRYGTPVKNVKSNVKIASWIPQNDLLGHPNVRAFVGHGGSNGVYECLYHGVPLVGMPLFGDHFDAMARVRSKGLGLTLDWKTLTELTLMDAINRVIDDPMYRRRMLRYSRIHHDHPMTALQRASHRIDYTIRYDGALHLHAVGLHLSWFQYLLIDLQLACLMVVLIGTWGVQWLMARSSVGRVPSRRRKRKTSTKKGKGLLLYTAVASSPTAHPALDPTAVKMGDAHVGDSHSSFHYNGHVVCDPFRSPSTSASEDLFQSSWMLCTKQKRKKKPKEDAEEDEEDENEDDVFHSGSVLAPCCPRTAVLRSTSCVAWVHRIPYYLSQGLVRLLLVLCLFLRSLLTLLLYSPYCPSTATFILRPASHGLRCVDRIVAALRLLLFKERNGSNPQPSNGSNGRMDRCTHVHPIYHQRSPAASGTGSIRQNSNSTECDEEDVVVEERLNDHPIVITTHPGVRTERKVSSP